MEKRRTALAILGAIIITLNSGSVFAERLSHEEKEMDTIKSFLGLMDSYLSIGEKWVKMVSAKETTIFFVTEKVTEIHKEKGEAMKAVPELRKILTKYEDNPTIRNVIHFKIAEIYKENGQAAEALEELNAIIEADRKR